MNRLATSLVTLRATAATIGAGQILLVASEMSGAIGAGRLGKSAARYSRNRPAVLLPERSPLRPASASIKRSKCDRKAGVEARRTIALSPAASAGAGR